MRIRKSRLRFKDAGIAVDEAAARLTMVFGPGPGTGGASLSSESTVTGLLTTLRMRSGRAYLP